MLDHTNDWSSWRLKPSASCVQQLNNHDCGVHTVFSAMYIAPDLPLPARVWVDGWREVILGLMPKGSAATDEALPFTKLADATACADFVVPAEEPMSSVTADKKNTTIEGCRQEFERRQRMMTDIVQTSRK